MALFGAGDLAEIAYLSLQETDLEFIGIGDADGNRHLFFGHPVFDMNTFANLTFDAVIVTHDQVDADILTPLRAAGIPTDKIKTL